MATLTFSLTSGPVTGSRAFTLSDADVTRWINAQRHNLSMAPASTGAQVLSAWALAQVDRAKTITRDYERDTTQFPLITAT